MSIADVLAARLQIAGYRICDECQHVIETIDSKGYQWAIDHKNQLARMLNANMRRKSGRVPMAVRTQWIERQIERACIAAIRLAQVASANVVTQGQHHGTV